MALRWSDIDLAAGKLKVERSLEQTVQQVRVKEPKTRAGRRSISLDAFAVAELRAHKSPAKDFPGGAKDLNYLVTPA